MKQFEVETHGWGVVAHPKPPRDAYVMATNSPAHRRVDIELVRNGQCRRRVSVLPEEAPKFMIIFMRKL